MTNCTGLCDCGEKDSINSKGFCCNHSGANNFEKPKEIKKEQIKAIEKLTVFLKTIFYRYFKLFESKIN